MSAPVLPRPAGPLAPATKAVLALEVVRAYARVRRLLRRTDLASVVAELRAGVAPAVDAPEAATEAGGLRLARVASRTLAALPLDSRCLMRSLVVTAMLARRGLGATVVIGVSPGQDFGAHAWVELGGRPLLRPDEETYGRLTEL